MTDYCIGRVKSATSKRLATDPSKNPPPPSALPLQTSSRIMLLPWAALEINFSDTITEPGRGTGGVSSGGRKSGGVEGKMGGRAVLRSMLRFESCCIAGAGEFHLHQCDLCVCVYVHVC